MCGGRKADYVHIVAHINFTFISYLFHMLIIGSLGVDSRTKMLQAKSRQKNTSLGIRIDFRRSPCGAWVLGGSPSFVCAFLRKEEKDWAVRPCSCLGRFFGPLSGWVETLSLSGSLFLLFLLLSLVSALFWGVFLASDIDFMGLIAMFIAIFVLLLICPRCRDLTRPGPRPGE